MGTCALQGVDNLWLVPVRVRSRNPGRNLNANLTPGPIGSAVAELVFSLYGAFPKNRPAFVSDTLDYKVVNVGHLGGFGLIKSGPNLTRRDGRPLTTSVALLKRRHFHHQSAQTLFP